MGLYIKYFLKALKTRPYYYFQNDIFSLLHKMFSYMKQTEFAHLFISDDLKRENCPLAVKHNGILL